MREKLLFGMMALALLAGCGEDGGNRAGNGNGMIEIDLPGRAVTKVFRNGSQVVNVRIFCPGQEPENHMATRKSIGLDPPVSFVDIQTGTATYTTCPVLISDVTYERGAPQSGPAGKDREAEKPEGKKRAHEIPGIVINNICPGASAGSILPEVEGQCGQ